MYTYTFPAYATEGVEKPRFSGFGSQPTMPPIPSQPTMPPTAPIQTWKNRVTYTKTDIKAARNKILAVPSAQQALGLLDVAKVRADEAAAIIAAEEQIGEWTRFRETAVDRALARARESYDAARGMAMSLGAVGVPPMSTWTMSSAPGTESAGVLAPAAAGEAPPREVPPNIIMMGLDPTYLLYGGLALGALIVLTSVLRR